MIFKSKLKSILFIIASIFVAISWGYIYNYTSEYKMYKYDHNWKIDTSKYHIVAPRYTKKRISPNGQDSLYYFYNIEKELVIKIKADSLKKYVIKK